MTEPEPRHDPLQPAVSKWVHYVGDGYRCMSAVVVAVDEDGQPSLRVFSDEDPAEDRIVHDAVFEQEVDEGASRPMDTWHWPVAW